MYVEIKKSSRSLNKLTTAQRTSSLFSEAPIVLGKILRRGSPNLKFALQQVISGWEKVYGPFVAGAIEISICVGDAKVDLRTYFDSCLKDKNKPSLGRLFESVRTLKDEEAFPKLVLLLSGKEETVQEKQAPVSPPPAPKTVNLPPPPEPPELSESLSSEQASSVQSPPEGKKRKKWSVT